MKVLTFNCWAIGYVPFMTKDREQRVEAIARFLAAKKERPQRNPGAGQAHC